MSIILVAVGGALGALSRFALSNILFSTILSTKSANFYWAILFINIVGSFLVVFVPSFFLNKNLLFSDNMRLFFTIGFCGAFTTFSTFSVHNLLLLKNGHYLLLVLNIVLSVSLSLIAAILGDFLGQKL